MKRFLWLALLLLAFPAQAQICSAVPFTLTNGTTADADEVMANFDATTSCVNTNAAKNGANSDITSLSGLTTPLSVAQGGTQTYTAAVSSTVANAYTTTSVSPSGYTLAINKTLRWIAPASNTASATFNPNSLGATTIYRVTTTAGVTTLAGGEIVSGGVYELMYNGTNLILMNPSVTDQPGEIKPFFGTSAPNGYVLAYGQAISRTDYAPLFAAIATNCGAGNGTTTFNVCDLRGRALFGKDDMGTAPANRVTNAGSGITGTTLAAAGGDQLLQTHNHSVVDPGHTHGISDPGHVHAITVVQSVSTLAQGGANVNVPANPVTANTNSATTGITGTASATTGIGVSSTGSGNSQNMPPTMIVNWMMRL